MLLEALVALALVLAFAAVLGPVLFQARRIMDAADDRIAAQALLRSLLEAPPERALMKSAREGEKAGLHWQITVTPLRAETQFGQHAPSDPQLATWKPYRVVASITWGHEHRITAETVRLARAQ